MPPNDPKTAVAGDHLTPKPPLSRAEFIALMAMMTAIVAFSIDAMLPSLPDIARDLTPDTPNRAQLIITTFVLGLGIGTLFAGPISDAVGRKPVVLGGAALFCVGSILSYLAPTLETVIAGRVLQGLGAAGPRVVTLAIVRDQYAGRGMAKIMSFVMLVFALVPAIAPAIGAGIIWATGWRGIFAAFVVFAVILSLWMGLRQPETHPAEARRPLRPRVLASSLREVLANRNVSLAIGVQALCYGMLFGVLASTQQIFDITFDRATSFPLWFGLVALIASTASILNATLVERLGMHFLIRWTLAAQIMLSALGAIVWSAGLLDGIALFTLFIIWKTSVFFQAGLTIGNINAIAMSPMGHIAGVASSVIGSVATIAGALVAIPLGLAFDGTAVPLMIGICLLALIARGLMAALPRAADTE